MYSMGAGHWSPNSHDFDSIFHRQSSDPAEQPLKQGERNGCLRGGKGVMPGCPWGGERDSASERRSRGAATTKYS